MAVMISNLIPYIMLHIIFILNCRVSKFLTRCKCFINQKLGFSGQAVSKMASRDFESSRKLLSITNNNVIADDGSVGREEVEPVMESLGIFCHPEGGKLQERLSSADLSDMFGETEPSLSEVKAAFDVFDDNRDGFIDAKELQRVLCVLGLKDRADIDSCRRMIRVYDNNGDGRIDFDEFVKFMETSFC